MVYEKYTTLSGYFDLTRGSCSNCVLISRFRVGTVVANCVAVLVVAGAGVAVTEVCLLS